MSKVTLVVALVLAFASEMTWAILLLILARGWVIFEPNAGLAIFESLFALAIACLTGWCLYWTLRTRIKI